MPYPDTMIRGIPNNNFLDENGDPHSTLFYFEQKTLRDDGLLENSINWVDDELSLDCLLKQNKESSPDELQFKAGAAVILRSEIERISSMERVKGKLTYERDKLPTNDYHGNLLLKGDTPKKVMVMIAANIALGVKRVKNHYFECTSHPVSNSEAL